MYDIFQFFTKYNLEHLIVDFVNNGNCPSRHLWKRTLNSKIKDQAHQDVLSQITDEGLQLLLTFHQQVKSRMFWDISKNHPRMLSACRSVIRLIALHFSRFTEAVCSSYGMFAVNFVSHCLLWCHANNNDRHKMWIGIWRKFGDALYIRLAGYDNETFLSVLFGNFDLIGDILDAKYKLDLHCYFARFIHIQRLVCDGIA